MSLPQQSQVTDWIGKRVVDPDGADLGSCTKLFADNDTGLVEWAGVQPESGAGDGRERIVPLVDAREQGGAIHVSVAREKVEGSPAMSGADRLTEDDEASLYRHYGIAASKEGSDSLLPAGEGETAPDGGASPDAANADGAPSTTPVPGTVQDDLAGTRETGSAPATGGPAAPARGGSAPLGAAPTGSGTAGSGTAGSGTAGSGTTAPTAVVPGATSASGGVQSNVRHGESSGSGGASKLAPAAAAGAALLVGATVLVLRRRQAAPPTPAERVGAGVRPLLHDAQLVATRGLADAATTAAEARLKVKGLAATAVPVVAGTGALAERARHGAEVAGSAARSAAQSGRGLGQKGARSGSDLGRTAAATAAGLGATLAREGAHIGHALSEAGHSVAETAGTAAERVAGTATVAGAAAAAAPARLAHAVVEAADEFEDDVERAWRKSVRRVLLVLGLGTGYVLGARDGRERYDQIVGQAQRLTGM